MENEKCKFAGVSRYCMILVGTKCRGDMTDCKFYKTERQFAEEADRAVRINRQKGNCEKCRYNKIPCGFSTEYSSKRGGKIENNPEY